MKLIVNVKLKTLDFQHDALLDTMKRANNACNWISEQAFASKTFQQFSLHHLTYYKVRESFDLTAQMAVHCISKVTDAYKINKERAAAFRSLGAIAYDHRILTFKPDNRVSIWTVAGRLNIPFTLTPKQESYFQHRKGEVFLIYRKKTFYLNIVCDISEAPIFDADDVLGVDFGIVNVATDSDGEQFSGKQIETTRQTFAHRRRNIRRRNTGSARRKVKRIGNKQSRFQKNENHIISKRLVEKAKDTHRAISLENLEGIRERVTVSKSQRHRLNNWSFYDLRKKIEYKAKLNGVPVIFIDPRNTSRQCSLCSHISKSNRKSQAEFVCQNCGHTANADLNAALNIGARATVKLPNETSVSR